MNEAQVTSGIFDKGPIFFEIADGVLELPPRPSILFKDRPRDEHGARLSLEVFLQETWGDYCDNWLMYSEWIRRIDPSLYKAILNRTANTGTFSEYCFERGILTKQHIRTPLPGYELQARIIRVVMAKEI